MDSQMDYYGEFGCCLTCDPEWQEKHLLDWNWEEYDDYPEEKKGYCLCRECMCRQCLWYEPDYDDSGCRDGGSCTYPRLKRVSKNNLSDKKIRNVVESTAKAVHSEIEGLLGLFWIPKSVIDNDGYIKEWFVKSKQKEVSNAK